MTLKDDFSDLFGSDYRTAKATVSEPRSMDEIHARTGEALKAYDDKIAAVSVFCKTCGKPVTNVFAVKYKSGRIFKFQQPCGHKL